MKRSIWLAAGVAALSGLGSAQTWAAAESDQLEEIVVTAEKRPENVQKVSISIQVKNGDELRKAGKKRIDEIMEDTVGIQAQGSPTGTSFYIRGVEPAPAGRGTPVTTPIIIDGVAQNRTETVRGGTLDVAQVEVMRGPQSTGLGANSLAGAISLVTNNPVFEYQGTGSLEYGNYNKQSVEGVMNLPLSDRQALRFAYSTDRRDGYYRSGTGDTDVQSARVKYRFKPSDDLDTVLTVSHQKIGGNGAEIGVRSSGHWEPYTGAPATAGSYSCTTVPSGALDTIGCPITYILVDDGTNFRTRKDAWNDGLPKNGWGWASGQNTTIDQANLEVTWNTKLGTVVVQPSYQRSHTDTIEAPMGVSGSGFAHEDIRENTSSVDARISSNPSSNLDGRLEWQAGIRYNVDDYGHNNLFVSTSAPGDMGCSQNSRCYSYGITPAMKATGESGYLNGKFSMVESLRLIGGLRYNHDSASVTQTNGFIAGDQNGPDPTALAAATNASGSRTWNKVTYRAGLEWDVVPNAMLYATYSTGYTPGTVSGMNLTGTDPVTLKQYTAGWKTQWLDNRLQFNGEAFASTFFNRSAPLPSVSTADATDCNYPQSPPGGPPAGVNGIEVIDGTGGGACAQVTGTVQVPEVQSNGLDMDMTWLITSADRLTLTAEYLKTWYKARPVVVGGFDASSESSIEAAIRAAYSGTLSDAYASELAGLINDNFGAIVGVQLQNAPKYSATLAYAHDFGLGSKGTFTPRIEGTYKDTYWSVGELGVPGAPTISAVIADTHSLYWQPSYTKWDAYGTWQSADGKFTLTGYVKNLTDKVIMTAYGQAVLLAAPRTFGVTVSAYF
ncbi:MAG: TonB-dependent receptor [Steroidobacteraceae bacterium]